MSLVTQNKQLWKTFSESLSKYEELVKTSIASGEIKEAHQLMRDTSWHPYRALHVLSDNIGAATGLFFEFNVRVFFVPFLLREIGSSLKVSYNTYPGHKQLGLPRDPDIHLSANGKEVVVELKVSPKKRDIDYVQKLKQRYGQHTIPYYFLGNQLSLNKQSFEAISELDWMSFLHASKRNAKYLDKFPTFDNIIDQISNHLSC